MQSQVRTREAHLLVKPRPGALWVTWPNTKEWSLISQRPCLSLWRRWPWPCTYLLSLGHQQANGRQMAANVLAATMPLAAEWSSG